MARIRSRIHTSPSPKGFRKDALLFSGFIQSESLAANAGFQDGAEGDLCRRNKCFVSVGSSGDKERWDTVDSNKFDAVPAG